MSVRPRPGAEVPALTARIACASNPGGTTAMWVRDRLDGLWQDEDFAGWLLDFAVNVERLYAHESPGQRERQPTAFQKYIIGRELPIPHWRGNGDCP